MKTITFEALPMAVAQLLQEVEEIRKLLTEKKPRAPDDTKMSIEKALIFLEGQGFVLSKSKLYKLTSIGDIPHHKFGKRLVFSESELSQWLRERTINPVNKKADSINEVSKSAMSKRNKKYK